MKKTKILWISQYAPISNDYSAGGRTFYYYFNQFKNDERFEVRLISCVMGNKKEVANKENKDIDHDFIYWSSSFKERLFKFVNIESRYNVFNKFAGMVNNTDLLKIRRILARYKQESYAPDVIILEWTNMVFLAEEIRRYYPQAKIIASEADVSFVGFERKKEYYKGINRLIWKIRSGIEKERELYSLSLCDIVMSHNPDNVDLLVKEGVDEKKVKWLVPYYEDFSSNARNKVGNDVVFYGAMARKENYLSAMWFINQVMPLLKDISIRFVVAGNNPPPQLKQLSDDKVVVTGFVESIKPYFSEGLCFVAPLVLGAGIKVKVLEALSSGIPVLTNSIGIEGIRVDPGKDYYHCETPEKYAEIIRKLSAKKENLSNSSAKETLKNKYSYERCANSYKRMILGGSL